MILDFNENKPVAVVLGAGAMAMASSAAWPRAPRSCWAT